MNIGDLLEGHGAVWLVRKIDPALKTGFLEAADGRLQVVGFEEIETSGFRHLCNASQEWPSAPLPQRRGRIVSVQRASTRNAAPLERFRDWVKLDDYQIGGSLYLNPELHLVYRDRLIVSYPSGDRKPDIRLPVEIPRDFVSLKAKAARQPPPAKPKGPLTLFDHLLEDE
jgi:hypothetical protein